ncbi:potassium transporter peripheral membrane component [Phycisphaerae bacterium RAS1]|nr:potassium transporter peripheral membrane component [Phycisphaerae bacterium RAS1]
MLRQLNIDQLHVSRRRRRPILTRLWREWCFVRVAVALFFPRVLILGVVLAGGALLFQRFEPEKQHSFIKAAYLVWSLVFAQPGEDFPAHPLLQSLFFIVPVLGLTVLIELIIELSRILRDRRSNQVAWSKVMAASMQNHIVLIGCGKLGFRVFKLLRRLGEPVVVIERDQNIPFLEEVRREGSPLLVGDARDDRMLIDAHVASARSIILASSDDLANLEIALDARRMNPGIRVVLRMFDQNLADKVREGFHIHIAISQSAMSAPAFAMAAVDKANLNSLVVNDQLVVMQRWKVYADGPIAGKSVGDLTATHGIGVMERRSVRGGAQLFPAPAAKIEAGDELLVQGPFEAITALRRKLGAQPG